jgi:hypothetical protein
MSFLNWTERLNSREVITYLVGAFVVGCITYVADEYIYRPCSIPVPWNPLGRGFTAFTFVGLSIAAYVVIGKISWFARHLGWMVAVSIAVVFILTALFVRFWCF